MRYVFFPSQVTLLFFSLQEFSIDCNGYFSLPPALNFYVCFLHA